MKQTAVEWLFEQVWITPVSELPKILEQAKEMEKHQIEDAYRIGYIECDENEPMNAEQYFNKTYKNTNK
jgi:hypothetical protein